MKPERPEKNTGLRTGQGRRLVDRIMEISPVGITVVDAAGSIIFANAEAERILGLTRSDITGRLYNEPAWHITRIDGSPFPDDDLPFRRVISTGKPVYGIEHTIQCPDGQRRLLCINATLLAGRDGKTGGMVAVIEDMTQRKLSEEHIKLSEEKFSRFFNSTPSLAAISDMHSGRLIDINDAFTELIGYSREESLGRTTAELNLWVDPGQRRAMVRAVEEGKTFRNVETQMRTKSGRVVTLLFSGDKFVLGGQELLLTQAIDITELVHAEDALRDSREKLRNFAAGLQSDREEERKRIAREIHDDLGQSLTALQIDLAWLARKSSGAEEQFMEKLRSISRLLNQMNIKVREISHALRPPMLDDLGLAAAVREYVWDFEDRTGIICSLSVEPGEFVTGPNTAITAYRIFQEAMTNIVRHAAARHISITLQAQNGTLLMEVEDDGRGIRAKDVTGSRSLGIIGMKERATLCGGKLEVTRLKGRGTGVKLSLPRDR